MLQFVVTLQVLVGTMADRIEAAGRDRGATAVEYGLLVALIAAGLVAIVTALRGSITGAFQRVITALT